MAELIASGTAAADSADFTVAAGTTATLFLKTASYPVPPGALATVQVKSGTAYFSIGTISQAEPMKVLSGAGTYRVRKASNLVAFGVDKE